MMFDLSCLAIGLVAYGLAELVNFIIEKRRDLEEVRKRRYPERCPKCHLYPENCTCKARPPLGRLGIWQ